MEACSIVNEPINTYNCFLHYHYIHEYGLIYGKSLLYQIHCIRD